MIGVVALAGLELGELLDQVLGVLALQDRVGRAAARAVGGVAGAAHGGGGGLALGQIGLGRRPAACAAAAGAARVAASRPDIRQDNRAAAAFMSDGFSGAKPDDFTMPALDDSWPNKIHPNPRPAPTLPTPPPRRAGRGLDAHRALPHHRQPARPAARHRAARDRLRRPLQRRQVDRDQHADAAEAPGLRLQDAGPHAAHQPVRAGPEATRPTRCSPTCPATATPPWRAATSCAGRR